MRTHLDHIVFAVPDLIEGMDCIEAGLGIRPRLGGNHPDFGTCNAILPLSNGAYLELVAPDLQLPEPVRGRAFGTQDIGGPRVATWAVRTPSIREALAGAESGGLNLGRVMPGSRSRPDGSRLVWKLTDPWIRPYDGMVPFLIDWGDTPHPSRSESTVADLLGMCIEHPDPDGVRAAIQLLGNGLAPEVAFGKRPRLLVQLQIGDRKLEIV